MTHLDNLKEYSRGHLRACQLKQLSILEVVDKICKKHAIEYWIDGGTLLGAVRHGGFIPWDDDIDIAMKQQDLRRFVAVAPQELPQWLSLQTPENEPDAKEPIVKIRDCNSLYIELGDDFLSDYAKGIFIDIFPFTDYPDVKPSLVKQLTHGMSKSNSILHHLHRYSWRSAAEFLWFGSKLLLYKMVWKVLCMVCKKSHVSDIPTLNGRGVMFSKAAVWPLATIQFEGKTFPCPHNPDAYLTSLYGDYMRIPPVEKREVHAVFILPELFSGSRQ